MKIITAIDRMKAMAAQENAQARKNWNTDVSSHQIRHQIYDTDEKKQTIHEILTDVADVTEIDADIIRGRSQRYDATIARRVAMTKARDNGYPIKEIAKYFGDREISTVYRAIMLEKAGGADR